VRSPLTKQALVISFSRRRRVMRYAVVIEKTQGNYSANEVELELS
jgi:hypothetical protein